MITFGCRLVQETGCINDPADVRYDQVSVVSCMCVQDQGEIAVTGTLLLSQ